MSDLGVKCLIILSYKSSGSSACQNLISGAASVRHVAKTRHDENETLYWTKAASILGLPQQKMLHSLVPLSAAKAKNELISLLQDNLEEYEVPNNNEDFIFGGWQRLCRHYAPVFLEKSPHHLVQWSALELILRCMQYSPEIEFYFIGLIRNPLDTLYSSWKRWQVEPELAQYEWLTAYRNLLEFEKLVKGKIMIIRYEDLVQNPSVLWPVFNFVNAQKSDINGQYLHRKAIAKWRMDRVFGFVLASEVKQLARQFGYSVDELTNQSNPFWPTYRTAEQLYYQSKKFVWRIMHHYMPK